MTILHTLLLCHASFSPFNYFMLSAFHSICLSFSFILSAIHPLSLSSSPPFILLAFHPFSHSSNPSFHPPTVNHLPEIVPNAIRSTAVTLGIPRTTEDDCLLATLTPPPPISTPPPQYQPLHPPSSLIYDDFGLAACH